MAAGSAMHALRVWRRSWRRLSLLVAAAPGAGAGSAPAPLGGQQQFPSIKVEAAPPLCSTLPALLNQAHLVAVRGGSLTTFTYCAACCSRMLCLHGAPYAVLSSPPPGPRRSMPAVKSEKEGVAAVNAFFVDSGLQPYYGCGPNRSGAPANLRLQVGHPPDFAATGLIPPAASSTGQCLGPALLDNWRFRGGDSWLPQDTSSSGRASVSLMIEGRRVCVQEGGGLGARRWTVILLQCVLCCNCYECSQQEREGSGFIMSVFHPTSMESVERAMHCIEANRVHAAPARAPRLVSRGGRSSHFCNICTLYALPHSCTTLP